MLADQKKKWATCDAKKLTGMAAVKSATSKPQGVTCWLSRFYNPDEAPDQKPTKPK